VKRIPNVIVLVLGFCLLTSQSLADSILIGTFSYDTFVPAGSGSAGIDAFNISNLTTPSFDLPPYFPVSGSLTFQSASLTLTRADLSQEVIDLGDIEPGFLLDPSGNPVVQVPGDQSFASAELKATLSAEGFALFDGASFTADSTLIDVILDRSSGSMLVADTDNTTIGLTGTILAAEPSSRDLVLLAFPGLAFLCRKRCKRADMIARLP
jgi:hypothetical protein